MQQLSINGEFSGAVKCWQKIQTEQSYVPDTLDNSLVARFTLHSKDRSTVVNTTLKPENKEQAKQSFERNAFKYGDGHLAKSSDF